jgi:hypothetical protein
VLVDLAERRHPVALMPSPPAGPAQIDLKGRTNSSSGNPTQSVNTDESPAVICRSAARERQSPARPSGSDPLQTQRVLRRVGRVSPAELTELVMCSDSTWRCNRGNMQKLNMQDYQ